MRASTPPIASRSLAFTNSSFAFRRADREILYLCFIFALFVLYVRLRIL